MKKMKNGNLNFFTMVSFVVLLFAGGNCFSENPANVESTNILTEESSERKLIPSSELAQKAADDVFGGFSKKVGYAAEKLYVVKKSDLKVQDSAGKTDFSIEKVSEIMRSISKMQGMMYFSRSRKKWDILYKDAFFVESLENQVPVADKTEGNGNGLSCYAMLNDHTFGKTVYNVKYSQNENELVMYMENATYMSYKGIKVVKPGAFKMCVSIIDNDDSFIIYMGTYSEFSIISALKERLNNSFMARLEAVYNWFLVQF